MAQSYEVIEESPSFYIDRFHGVYAKADYERIPEVQWEDVTEECELIGSDVPELFIVKNGLNHHIASVKNGYRFTRVRAAEWQEYERPKPIGFLFRVERRVDR